MKVLLCGLGTSPVWVMVRTWRLARAQPGDFKMRTITKQTDIQLWHYTCPECGIGNAETGYTAQEHMIYCEVCLEDGEQVKLKRWPVDHDSGPTSSRRLTG